MPPRTAVPPKRRNVQPVAVNGGAALRFDLGVNTRAAPNGLEYDHSFVISTERLATDGGVIRLAGWGWKEFLDRPRWIAMHDLGGYGSTSKLTEMSLGRVVDVAIENGLPEAKVGKGGRGLVAYVKYDSGAFAQEVKRMYDEGSLSDVSVRWDWRTEVVRAPYEEEVLEYGENLYWVCERADLVELSAVLLGADPGNYLIRSEVRDALVAARTAGKPFTLLEKLAQAIEERNTERKRAMVLDFEAILSSAQPRNMLAGLAEAAASIAATVPSTVPAIVAATPAPVAATAVVVPGPGGEVETGLGDPTASPAAPATPADPSSADAPVAEAAVVPTTETVIDPPAAVEPRVAQLAAVASLATAARAMPRVAPARAVLLTACEVMTGALTLRADPATDSEADTEVDGGALADSLAQMDEGMRLLDQWLDSMGTIKTTLTEAMTGIRNLLLAAGDPDADAAAAADADAQADDTTQADASAAASPARTEPAVVPTITDVLELVRVIAARVEEVAAAVAASRAPATPAADEPVVQSDTPEAPRAFAFDFNALQQSLSSR